MPGNPRCVSVRPADATLALQRSFIYAPVPYAFQMITIHHRATSGSLNSLCGLIEREGWFSFPPLSCSGSGSLRRPQAAPPRRWCPGHGAAWGWMAARRARRGFQQGKRESNLLCHSQPSQKHCVHLQGTPSKSTFPHWKGRWPDMC